jgi:hypothetical protein
MKLPTFCLLQFLPTSAKTTDDASVAASFSKAMRELPTLAALLPVIYGVCDVAALKKSAAKLGMNCFLMLPSRLFLHLPYHSLFFTQRRRSTQNLQLLMMHGHDS